MSSDIGQYSTAALIIDKFPRYGVRLASEQHRKLSAEGLKTAITGDNTMVNIIVSAFHGSSIIK